MYTRLRVKPSYYITMTMYAEEIFPLMYLAVDDRTIRITNSRFVGFRK
jgi:hypothetical protein